MSAPRWAQLSIQQYILTDGYVVTITTNTPCHLWLLWTDRPPWVHRKTAIQRGLNVPWYAYWCYVTWTGSEQQEPGDTLIHTFIWTGWQVCNTRWFRFAGTIGSVQSPSDSPIFQKHFPGPEPPPQVYFPPLSPYSTTCNAWWCAQPFVAPEDGTPNVLTWWVYVYDTLVNDMCLYIEEIDPGMPPYHPYEDQPGHIIAEAVIPKEDLNTGIGEYKPYNVSLTVYAPLVKGMQYAMVRHPCTGGPGYMYSVKASSTLTPDYRMKASSVLGDIGRNWLAPPGLTLWLASSLVVV